MSQPGARKRVAEVEDEIRFAAGLIALPEQAGLLRDKRLGGSGSQSAPIQPPIMVVVVRCRRYRECQRVFRLSSRHVCCPSCRAKDMLCMRSHKTGEVGDVRRLQKRPNRRMATGKEGGGGTRLGT
jgi:hypothetical protein